MREPGRPSRLVSRRRASTSARACPPEVGAEVGRVKISASRRGLRMFRERLQKTIGHPPLHAKLCIHLALRTLAPFASPTIERHPERLCDKQQTNQSQQSQEETHTPSQSGFRQFIAPATRSRYKKQQRLSRRDAKYAVPRGCRLLGEPRSNSV